MLQLTTLEIKLKGTFMHMHLASQCQTHVMPHCEHNKSNHFGFIGPHNNPHGTILVIKSKNVHNNANLTMQPNLTKI